MKSEREVQLRINYMNVQIVELEEESKDYKVGSKSWADCMTQIFEVQADIRLLLWVLDAE